MDRGMMHPCAPCVSCGSPVEIDPELRLGSGAMCQPCIIRSARENTEKARDQARLAGWQRICPPRYQDTVIERLPFPEKSSKAIEWDFPNGLGLNLWGFPASGKTRSLYLVLRGRYDAGASIDCYAPADFTQKLADKGFKRGPWARRMKEVDFLAFDDVDKLNLTREQELFFFGLLDRRMSHNKPCLFTHNSTADALSYTFRNGAAMVRRIRDFTRSLHFPQRQEQQRLI